jgi:hypothetical protein
MQINLTFNSLDELRDYCEMALRGMSPRDTVAELTVGEITVRGSEQFVKDLTEAGNFDAAAEVALRNVDEPHVEAEQPDSPTEQPEPTKRKRRTKAEIEADKAAQELSATVVAAEAPAAVVAAQASPLDNLQPETAVHHTGHNDQARAEITEMAGLFDGTDKLAHLNEGRQFIEKHGFPIYNETLQLADVPANIASHTPEQVSRHRAAMAWKAAQKAGG